MGKVEGSQAPIAWGAGGVGALGVRQQHGL